MTKVIILQDALHKRMEARSHQPVRVERPRFAMSMSPACRRQPTNEDIDRAIMLLDAAAEQARHMVEQANDLSRTKQVEQQAGSIVQLLSLARSMTSRLE